MDLNVFQSHFRINDFAKLAQSLKSTYQLHAENRAVHHYLSHLLKEFDTVQQIEFLDQYLRTAFKTGVLMSSELTLTGHGLMMWIL